MAHFVGLDVSVQQTSVCVVDDVGKVLCERKVRTEPEDIAVLLTSIGGDYVRIGIEAGPLSQWLVSGLTEADLPVVCVETRHMKLVKRSELLTHHAADRQQRLHDGCQPRKAFDQVPDPRFVSDRADDADLEAKVAQCAAHVALDVHQLADLSISLFVLRGATSHRQNASGG
jgi:transposase